MKALIVLSVGVPSGRTRTQRLRGFSFVKTCQQASRSISLTWITGRDQPSSITEHRFHLRLGHGQERFGNPERKRQVNQSGNRFGENLYLK